MNKSQRMEFVAKVEANRGATPVAAGELTIPMHRGYFVYLLWSAAEECIYVGRTGSKRGGTYLISRISDHARKEWWGDVAQVTYQEFGSFKEVWAVELALIEEMRPARNANHRVCLAGLHDITSPDARWADGRCRACALARSAEYRKANKPTHEQRVRWRKNHRKNVGEEEFKRRINAATDRYRSKKDKEEETAA